MLGSAYDTLRYGFLDALLWTRPTSLRFIGYLCCDVKAITCHFAAIPCRLCYERNSIFIPHVGNFAVLVPGCR